MDFMDEMDSEKLRTLADLLDCPDFTIDEKADAYEQMEGFAIPNARVIAVPWPDGGANKTKGDMTIWQLFGTQAP